MKLIFNKYTEVALEYMFVCHRIPERSFFYKGKQLPICSRCTGILIGYLIGIIYILVNKKINILIELVLMIPMAIDGFGQLYKFWISNNTRRLITGILAGISTICIIRACGYLGYTSGKYVYNLIL